MPRVKKQTARADIYRIGLNKKDPSTKSGFRKDRSKPKDENDEILIPKGSIYYMWSFRFGGTFRSLVMPRPSQLTQSDFLTTIYGWQENLEDFDTDNAEDLNEYRDNIVEDVETLIEETQEKLDNMQDYNLAETPTGELLQERIDALEEYKNELESFEADEDDVETSLEDLKQISLEI